MDTNQNSLVQYQEMTILEDEDSKTLTTDNDELQKRIDELDDDLDSIVAKKGVLQDKKAALEQQVQILNKEKRKQQRLLRQRKCSKGISIFIFFLAIVIGIIGCIITIATFQLADAQNVSASIDELKKDFQAKCSELDQLLEPLTQQRDELQDKIVQIQDEIAGQEADLLKQEADSLKAQIISYSDQLDVASTVLEENNRKELDAYIASLNRYPDKRVELKEHEGISYYEVAEKYDLGQYMLNDSGNAVIYPGAVLRGDSLMKGIENYSLVAENRALLTLVCSHGGNSIRLENVSYGTVQKAVEQLWEESNPEYSKNWEYTLHSAKNEEELNLSLGIGYGPASASLGVSHTETTSSMAITFTETYFSIVAEPLSSATQYFQVGSDLKSLGDYEPAYVSSVDYGRRIVVMVTTDLSENELNAKLGANIKGVDIGADIGYIRKNIDSNCRIFCYGGDSAKTLQAIDDEKSGGLKGWWDRLINGEATDVDGFNQMITADDSLVNPLPLAYHLNYLSDNSAVPATVIVNDNVILAKTAKLVTLSLEGNVEGTFQLSDSASAIGYVVDTDQIQITKKGNTSGKIQFIWDSSQPAALAASFNGSPVSYQLGALQTDTDNIFCLATSSGIGEHSTYIHINISDAIYEIQ